LGVGHAACSCRVMRRMVSVSGWVCGETPVTPLPTMGIPRSSCGSTMSPSLVRARGGPSWRVGMCLTPLSGGMKGTGWLGRRWGRSLASSTLMWWLANCGDTYGVGRHCAGDSCDLAPFFGRVIPIQDVLSVHSVARVVGRWKGAIRFEFEGGGRVQRLPRALRRLNSASSSAMRSAVVSSLRWRASSSWRIRPMSRVRMSRVGSLVTGWILGGFRGGGCGLCQKGCRRPGLLLP
jgi:hypothetical protein